MQNRRRLTACFFGDGAVAEGEFHESLNLAALWNLPVLFLCENNLYAMGTHVQRHQAQIDLCRKALSYNMPSDSVDGMDVIAVEAAARRAAEAVRENGTPYFLEARTYRFRAHSMYDAELYRSKQEVEEWKKRDPIPALERRLRELGMLDDRTWAAMKQEATAKVGEAVAFAEEGPWEPAENLLKDVYTPVMS